MLFVNKRMKDSSTLSIWIYPTCNMVGIVYFCRSLKDMVSGLGIPRRISSPAFKFITHLSERNRVMFQLELLHYLLFWDISPHPDKVLKE